MKKSIQPITPLNHYLGLFHQPRIQPRSIFWKAFYHLQKHGTDRAREILYATYFTPDGDPKDSRRLQKIQALACGRFVDINTLDWAEVLAASNCSICLSQLLKAKRLRAVHAAHAEIELGRTHNPNPLLRALDEAMNHLLLLYSIEEDLLSESAHSSPRLKEWFRKRRSRAMTYFEIYEGDDTVSDASPHDINTHADVV